MRANTIMRLEGGWKEGLLGALYSGWECLAMGNTRIPDGKGWAGQTWAGWEEKNCAKVHWRSHHKEYLRFTKDGRRDHAVQIKRAQAHMGPSLHCAVEELLFSKTFIRPLCEGLIFLCLA